jgi:hypothetical protein
MSSLLPGEPFDPTAFALEGVDLANLDPKRDVPRIRTAISERVAAGGSVAPLLAALRDKNPVALADVVVGPQAVGGPDMVRAALGLAPALEQHLAPQGLYRRLVDLGGAAVAPEVLEMAARRHPAGTWLVALSDKVEREDAGFIHLRAAQGHPSFTACCWAHADAGHHRGLLLIASEIARPEPVAALLSAGNSTLALEAAARVLERNPRAPVVAFLAAVWGPDIDALLVRIIPHLRTADAVRSLVEPSRRYPRASMLLEVVGRGLSR